MLGLDEKGGWVGEERLERKEVTTMEWQFVVALAVAVPVVLVPAAFVWYLTVGGIFRAVHGRRHAETTPEERVETVAMAVS